jgi:stage IV sporulation protein B
VTKIRRQIIAIVLTLFCIEPALAQETGIKQLVPLGYSTGISVRTEGVMVIGISPVQTKNGEVSPCRSAGITEGDTIVAIDGEKIKSNDMLKKIVDKSRGRELKVSLIRDNHELTVSVKPEKNTDGEFKLGIWIRDSLAGIGTLTFYEPDSNMFGALGHGICDTDTNKLVPLGSGFLMESSITDIKKGIPGSPGELIGDYNPDKRDARLISNTPYGIFGYFEDNNRFAAGRPIPVCPKNAVKTGPAVIISNIEGNQIKEYRAEILRVYSEDSPDGKNMLIQLTDPEIINKTGGIVQGMSGSPILQDGKIVGAVTHVLVNEPRKGYGIFIENMLREGLRSIRLLEII